MAQTHPGSPPLTCVSEAVELMPSKSRSLSAFWSPLTWWPLESEPLRTVPFSVGPGPQRGCQMAVPGMGKASLVLSLIRVEWFEISEELSST